MSAAGRMAGLHRFARLLALAALVLYQPLAAFHFATDEAHIANSATSIQVAAHGGHAHDHAGHPAGGDDQTGGHSDPFCEFCLLAGSGAALGHAVVLEVRPADDALVEAAPDQVGDLRDGGHASLNRRSPASRPGGGSRRQKSTVPPAQSGAGAS